MKTRFASQVELQGHRGARGLKPENTLPSFEVALDAGVTSIETDVHLTRDGVPVLCHDAALDHLATAVGPGHSLPQGSRVSQLTLAECRSFRVDRNPDPSRFPQQDNHETPAAAEFARGHGLDPFGVPTLADLFTFVASYAGAIGQQTGKTDAQRARAGCLRFDLELKRVPFEPQTMGDDFGGIAPGLLERRIVEEVRRASVLKRSVVRSFDHRCVRAIKRLEPELTTAVLVAGTAPVSAVTLTRDAEASIYCPEYLFLDEQLTRSLRDAGLRILPWTVNRPEDWQRLLAWGVDGITTDYPDRLAKWLQDRGLGIA